MNDIPKSVADQASVPGWELAIAGSDAVQKVCNQGQAVAKATMDWNAECSRFLTHRFSKTSQAVAQITKCRTVPEMFEVQAKWLQTAVEDYMKETSSLLDMNSKIISYMVPRFTPGETSQSAATTPTKVGTLVDAAGVPYNSAV